MAKARKERENDLYIQLKEDCGKKRIYKLAKDREVESKDVRGGTVLKDKDGKLAFDANYLLKIWEVYFKQL